VNETGHLLASRFHYLQPKTDTMLMVARTYVASRCDAPDYLRRVINRAIHPVSFEPLLDAILEGTDATREDAEEYLHTLIDAGVLLSSIEPVLTGTRDDATTLVSQLSELPETRAMADSLGHVISGLQGADHPTFKNMDEYRVLADTLPSREEFGTRARYLNSNLRVQLVDAEVGATVVDVVTDALQFLHEISVPAQRPLEAFCRRFVERYGTREVPLLEALDDDLGLGSNEPGRSELIEGISFRPASESRRTWRKRDDHLLARVMRASREREDTIYLDEADRDQMRSESGGGPFLSAFCALATVSAANASSLEAGEFSVYVYGYSPSIALLSRFCLYDKALLEAVSHFVEREQEIEGDVVLADVVHQPGRYELGNVVKRPSLRGFEIPYLGVSGAAVANQILPSDLTVTVRAETVILRSRRLGKRVLPRIGTAHAYKNEGNLPIYQFLGDVETQEITHGATWTWPPGFEFVDFLPRVQRGRAIFSLAQWRLDRKAVAEFVQSPRPLEIARLWQDQRRMPRHICFTRASRLLPIDLNSEVSLSCLQDQMRGRSEAVLVEMFPEPDGTWLRGPTGRHSQEIVLPYLSASHDATSVMPVQHSPSAGVRTLIPGSPCLYLKCYLRGIQADEVIGRTIPRILAAAEQVADLERWFFIRYADPEPHIRLRIFSPSPALLGEVCGIASRMLMETPGAAKVQIETYEREVERYGGAEGVLLAERWFHVDSAAVAEILAGPELVPRWQATLAGVAAILRDFRLDAESQVRVAREMRAAFWLEFRLGDDARRHLAQKYRVHRSTIQAALRGDGAVSELINRRSASTVHIADQLLAATSGGRISRSIEELIRDFCHMHVNRMICEAAREHEAVIYDFLHLGLSEAGARGRDRARAGSR